MRARVEFTVEPFVAGSPGPHVLAAVESMADAGLSVNMGPFGNVVEGESDVVIDAVAAMIRAARANGADRVQLEIALER